MIKFIYGISYKGFLYGWYKKELYRLPSADLQRGYSLKKLQRIIIGNKTGYRLRGDKLTMEQLEEITTLFNEPLIVLRRRDKDLPF